MSYIGSIARSRFERGTFQFSIQLRLDSYATGVLMSSPPIALTETSAHSLRAGEDGGSFEVL